MRRAESDKSLAGEAAPSPEWVVVAVGRQSCRPLHKLAPALRAATGVVGRGQWRTLYLLEISLTENDIIY